MYNGHMFGFGGPIMWIFWILVIAVIVWAVRAAFGTGSHSEEKKKSALEVLRERYAKGEIDREEYAQKSKDLNQ